MKVNLVGPESFESMRVKHRVKIQLEELQDAIREKERMHKRPPLSEVVELLIQCWRERERAPTACPPELIPRDYRERETIHGVLGLLRDEKIEPAEKEAWLSTLGWLIEDYLQPRSRPRAKRKA